MLHSCINHSVDHVILQTEDIYTYLDLYVGATIVVHNRTFELDQADEYTLTYMENNKVRGGYTHCLTYD